MARRSFPLSRDEPGRDSERSQLDETRPLRQNLLRNATVLGMAETISQREPPNDSGAGLRRVQAGQTLVVTRNGVAVAELRPLAGRRFVPRELIAEAARTAPRIDARRFRADLEAVVDAAIEI